MLKLYNSLGRRVEAFRPITNDLVKLYSCGPTVYDYAQIGNLRAFVFVDTLRRSLEFLGFNVKHVMNITDVGHLVSDMDEGEDKLEKGAIREGKTVWEVAEFYTGAFMDDAQQLNILPPNGYDFADGPYARATKFIEAQISIVSKLLENGFAYPTAEAIYFDVSKLPTYGELSGQNLKDKEVGARQDVVTDSNKRHPQDFALWFLLVGRFKNHTMHWDSPWGAGFPGWHLECSAIIHETLGETIDIHTGGVDHIGTHHTNEMAQSEAAFGKKLSNYWLHNDFVLVDGQKMSKSLGNFYTLKDLTAKGFDAIALRLLFLQAHYRSQLNFTFQSLEAAAQNLKALQAWADLVYQQDSLPEPTKQQSETLLNLVKEALFDDLNTAVAIGYVNEVTGSFKPDNDLLKKLDSIFGLKLSDRQDIIPLEKDLIHRRQEARRDNNWQLADKLRDELADKGLEINDTSNGPIWSRR